MKKFLCFFAAFAFLSSIAWGQTVTLGSGTVSNATTVHPTPYGTYYKNHRVQYLILASELTSIGLLPGNITALGFNVDNMNTCSSMPNYTIKLKHTTVNELTTTFDNGAYTTVWTNPNFLPVAGWNTHTFSNPFLWDGTSGLLIDICFDIIPGDFTQNASVFYTETSVPLAAFYRSDAVVACGTTNAATTSPNRANMQITGVVASCLPPFNLMATNLTTSSADLGWTPVGSETIWNIKYGAPGFNPVTEGTLIPNVNTNPYNLAGLSPLTQYAFYVQADCGSGDLSNWAGPAFFQTTSDPLSGNYTINSTLPSSGTNFNNFSDFASAINLGGFAGPVVVDVAVGTGPYTEQVMLNELPNSSAVNTLTINGNGETLQFLSANTNERGTLKLNGTDYVTVDNLIIKALGSVTGEYGWAVWLTNNADFNTFNNCQFVADMTATLTNFVAFVTSNSATGATTAGLAASNLTVTNCEAVGGYYGMVINGPTSAPFAESSMITDNEIRDFRLYGLYVRGQNNAVFSENMIYRSERSEISTSYMLYLASDMSGTEFTNNQIFDFAGSTVSTSTAYGIYGTGLNATAGQEVLIANNLVRGFEGMNGSQYAIYLITTSNTRLYHNTVAMDHVNHTGSSIIRGIYHSGANSVIDIRNNIVSVNSNSTGIKYCMYLATNTATVTSDNNVLYMGATAGTNYMGYWNAASYNTLGDWQTFFDQNSVDADPMFVDVDAGDLTPQSPFADNIGADLTAYVPFDIYGEPRTTTPDPGAIEFDGPSEGTISGVVLDAATNEPVVGALVIAGDLEYVTVAGGEYEFILFGGEYIFEVHKAGYATLYEPVTIMSGQTHVLDLMLYESANVPGPVLAELNTGETAVNISWGLPGGQYEIMYDDGIADNATAWGLSGNMNALRFTPAGYPVKVLAGSVNIYDGTYPPNGNALVPFQMAVYDDSGPNGYPGEELGLVTVTPTDYGWVNFNFSEFDITINSGDFYLVMIQGGNFPNCAPIAIDQTSPVMRSYSRFFTGGAPWTPAGFNDFMMRAIVEGPGGPGMLAYASDELIGSERISIGALFLEAPQNVVAPVGAGIFKPIEGTGTPDRAAIGYRVYRLGEGDEGDESLWTLLGDPTGTSIVDNSWPGLDDGAYRWAVKAKYALDIFSEPTFSNVLGKNWGSDVSVVVTLSDPGVSPEGIQVALQNTVFPQYNYNATTNADGEVEFIDVWKGNYDLTVFKFAYDPYMMNVEIEDATHMFNVSLMETPIPPTGLYVNPVQIHATWEAPEISLDLLAENWSSGGFTANAWTIDPPTPHWSVITTFGNPAPSARFYFSPSITNYSHAMVSQEFSGVGLPSIMLKYDLYLSNYSTATLEQMGVDVWNGSSWVNVANYTNAGGSIAWTSYTHDITQHALGQNFKVRFRAYGANSFNINNWNIDNIMVYGEVADGGDRSVLGYFVYLDDVVAGFTEETFFQYQPEYVNYGQTYTAGVQAVYESGISEMITYVFTSQFLYPPCNLEGEDVGHAVALTWEAPGTCDPFGGGGGGGGGTGELYEIKYHNGVPLDGYFQQFNYGYGVVFDVAAYSNVTVEKADFRHSPWG
ncbi:MAG: fibronectin type III domain-containing protein, partial [Bacteroidales bacterium]|nr:fibronectin type III domain-containing protein [Bacteroidales bacterium]